MTPQTLYYVLFILIIVFVVRRMLQQRNIPYYSPSQLESRMKESAVVLLLKNGLSAANLRGGIAEWNFHKLEK